jgi:hypothetical protein
LSCVAGEAAASEPRRVVRKRRDMVKTTVTLWILTQ